MATLLLHFISDFLRDESLRCRVMEDEDEAYTAHGLSITQREVLRQVRDGNLTREQFLAEIGREIEPIRFEAGAGIPYGVLQYPAGDVEIHSYRVDSNGDDRWVRVVGIGFTNDCTVNFMAFDGTNYAGNPVKRSCDPDVWQRLTVTATLPAGTYTMTITRDGGVSKSIHVVCP